MKNRSRDVLRFQLALDFSQIDNIRITATSPAGPVPVQLDPWDRDRLKGRRVSLGSHGYAQIWDNGRHELLHRWILGCKVRDGRLVDHRNGDRYDCRRSNLRIVTPAENAANRRPTSISGLIGVEQTPSGAWRARGHEHGRTISLGTYADAREAARVSHEWRLANLPGYLGRGMTNLDHAQHLTAA